MQIDHARVSGESVLAEPLMTVDEVAAVLGVHRKFIYARLHSGVLRGYKVGPQYRFRPTDVRAFLEANLAPVDGEGERAITSTRRAAPAGSFRALLEGRAA
jgi:excisionase family DNA binding protein